MVPSNEWGEKKRKRLTLRLFFSVWYAESSSFQFSSNDFRFERTAWFFSITAFGSFVVGSFANN